MHADMHRIGVAKQIVHIAEDFLICTHKEHTKIIRLAIFYRMDRQGVGEAVARYETVDFAVGVASDVLNRSRAGRLLVKT